MHRGACYPQQPERKVESRCGKCRARKADQNPGVSLKHLLCAATPDRYKRRITRKSGGSLNPLSHGPSPLRCQGRHSIKTCLCYLLYVAPKPHRQRAYISPHVCTQQINQASTAVFSTYMIGRPRVQHYRSTISNILCCSDLWSMHCIKCRCLRHSGFLYLLQFSVCNPMVHLQAKWLLFLVTLKFDILFFHMLGRETCNNSAQPSRLCPLFYVQVQESHVQLHDACLQLLVLVPISHVSCNVTLSTIGFMRVISFSGQSSSSISIIRWNPTGLCANNQCSILMSSQYMLCASSSAAAPWQLFVLKIIRYCF